MRFKGKYSILFGMLCFLCLIACKKEKPETSETSKSIPPNRHLKVTVRHIYNLNGQLNDSLLPSASVKLYLDTFSRKNDFDLVTLKSTDSLGDAKFLHLKENYYYLRVIHNSLGILDDEVSTPDKSTSFLEVRF